MDKQFQMSADTFFVGRYRFSITKIRKKMKEIPLTPLKSEEEIRAIQQEHKAV